MSSLAVPPHMNCESPPCVDHSSPALPFETRCHLSDRITRTHLGCLLVLEIPGPTASKALMRATLLDELPVAGVGPPTSFCASQGTKRDELRRMHVHS